MILTAICPVLNEEDTISSVIDFFLTSKPEEKELLIIDGGSADNTLRIIREAEAKNPNIHICINKDKYVPYALNLGIKNSGGNLIVRLDAHTEYAADYFLKIIETFEKTGADIVGGPMIKDGKTVFQKAAAYVTSTVFGIGGSRIHDRNYSGYSDHVYLGAWKKSLFEEIGLFDERMKRNQDDEFHYRAKSKGKKIFLNPEIISCYYPRKNLKSFIWQYFQYGLYKPMVSARIRSEIKLRHLIPSVFFIYLVSSLFLFSFYPAVLIPAAVYLLLSLFFAFRSKLAAGGKLMAFILYPSIHISYGAGYIIGILKMLLMKRSPEIESKIINV